MSQFAINFFPSGTFTANIAGYSGPVVVGDELSLTCSTSGTRDDNVDFSWLFVGQSASIVAASPTYTKRNVSIADSGNYTCIAVSADSQLGAEGSVSVVVVTSIPTGQPAAQTQSDSTGIVAGILVAVAIAAIAIGIGLFIQKRRACEAQEEEISIELPHITL